MSKEKKYWANTKTFSTILKIVWIMVLVLAILSLVKSCAVCNYRATIKDKTGYLPDNDNMDNIPDVVPPYVDDEDSLNLGDRVMLEHLFPPIGDQGENGTCVAFAVGYNLKTALNAIDSGWTTEMLKNPVYQTSPKDLWLCIPPEQRGGCSGTGFEMAFNALSTKGAASMEEVPYDNLQGCGGIGKGDTCNRIFKYYHVVNNGGMPSVAQLKAYLSDTIPLVFGARLGDRFMKWNSDKVISHDTYNYTGMHAYHAMTLVGYDDALHAFRVRNSWGPEWGDQGSIWVDYNFFIQELCYVVFMVENGKTNNN